MAKKTNVAPLEMEEMMVCDHMHEMFDDQFEGIVEIIKNQQQTSLELTKLVLAHGNIQNLDEKKIHQLFQNAVDVVAKSYDKSFGK